MVTHLIRTAALTGLACAGTLAVGLVVAQPAAAGGAGAPAAASQSVMRSTGRAVDRAIQNSLRHRRQSAILSDRAEAAEPQPKASNQSKADDGATANATAVPQD